MNHSAIKTIDFSVVIPARFGSTRLPGKPLKQIAGKTMIERVYHQADRSGAQRVIVATDDSRIYDEVERFGGRVMMTSNSHRAGTDRVAEVANRETWNDDTIVVNLQGDEPTITPELIRLVGCALRERPEAGIATLATPIQSHETLIDPNTVKVVLDDRALALYFSRAPIPWDRNGFKSFASDQGLLRDDDTYLRHVGLYAYRVGSLRRIAESKPCKLESLESLEQLRAMFIGIKIHVAVVNDVHLIGVDTLDDLVKVEAYFERQERNKKLAAAR